MPCYNLAGIEVLYSHLAFDYMSGDGATDFFNNVVFGYRKAVIV